MEQDVELKNFTTTDKVSSRHTCGITISSNIEDQWDKLITIARCSYRFYAYIIHDKDIDDNGTLKKPHLHLVCWNNVPTSLKSHCDLFGSVIEPNFICKIRSIRGVCRYLTHIDFPSKYQYDFSQIKTNSVDNLKQYFETQDAFTEYKDIKAVYQGKMTIDSFIEKYSSAFSKLNLYQKIALIEKINKGVIIYEK